MNHDISICSFHHFIFFVWGDPYIKLEKKRCVCVELVCIVLLSCAGGF
jgi:hypothetical protein